MDWESLEGLLWVLWGVPCTVFWVAAKPYEDCVCVGMQVSLILPACVWCLLFRAVLHCLYCTLLSLLCVVLWAALLSLASLDLLDL